MATFFWLFLILFVFSFANLSTLRSDLTAVRSVPSMQSAGSLCTELVRWEDFCLVLLCFWTGFEADPPVFLFVLLVF